MNKPRTRIGWLTIALPLLVLFAVQACGGSMETPAAPESQGVYDSQEQVAKVESGGAPHKAGGEAYAFNDEQTGYETGFSQGLSPSKGAPLPAPPPPQQVQAVKAGGYELQAKGGKSAPEVVYTGYLKLQVRRMLEAVDAITALTEKRGGYVESLTPSAIVVRVPGADFETVLKEFAAIGEVLDQRVKAVDVSQEFTDLGARLAVAQEARNRLLALLERTKDVKERLQLVQEIKRLSEQIESIDSTLATLRNLVDFYTISIDLVPLVAENARVGEPSPFGWISALIPSTTTLGKGKGDFELTPPSDFVVFDEDKEYRAQAADTSILRCAKIDNEPRGDNLFWADAVDREMLGRGEKVVEKKTTGTVAYRIYKNDDLKPRYYLVGLAVAGDDLFVLEVFFPNEAAYKQHHAAVVQALATFKAK